MKKFFKEHLGVILIAVVVLVGYVLLTDVFHVLNSFLFYSIGTVPPLFVKYLPQLMDGLRSSLLLLVIAYSLALVLGIAAGSLIGLSRKVRKNVVPYINAFSAIPVTLLTPYAINLFPSFWVASIFIIFLGCFWIILGSTITAVLTIDRRYLENSATLEIPPVHRLFRIVLPAAAPAILTGCQIALKLAFMLLAVAEMFGATSGMGYFIQYYSDFGRFDVVAVGFIFMAIVLVLLMYGFDMIKARILHWTINN